MVMDGWMDEHQEPATAGAETDAVKAHNCTTGPTAAAMDHPVVVKGNSQPTTAVAGQSLAVVNTRQHENLVSADVAGDNSNGDRASDEPHTDDIMQVWAPTA